MRCTPAKILNSGELFSSGWVISSVREITEEITKMQFSENFGLRLDELSQFSAITTKTVTIPGESDIKTEKRQFSKNQNSQNCRFSVLIPDPPGIVTVWVVPALN